LFGLFVLLCLSWLPFPCLFCFRYLALHAMIGVLPFCLVCFALLAGLAGWACFAVLC
jgi:hypothetical protein